MTIIYTVRGHVQIVMFDYIKEIITAFDKAELNRASMKSHMAPVNLFHVNSDCVKLSPEKHAQFYNLVAKILYTTKRTRPDTCTAVAFLII